LVAGQPRKSHAAKAQENAQSPLSLNCQLSGFPFSYSAGILLQMRDYECSILGRCLDVNDLQKKTFHSPAQVLEYGVSEKDKA